MALGLVLRLEGDRAMELLSLTVSQGFGGSHRSERRSERLSLAVPVLVYGKRIGQGAFRKRTRTLSVSAHGGRIVLGPSPRVGQSLLVVNEITQEEQECRVVHTEREFDGQLEVGIAFTRPAPDFWKVRFPRL